MLLLDLLDDLDRSGVTLRLSGTRITAQGSRHAVEELAPALRAHRDLLAAHLVGVETGHLLAFCEECGAPTITAAKLPSGAPRKNWPRCRDRPACGGRDQHGTPRARHVPRPTDLASRRAAPAPPPSPKPPPKVDRRRLFGPRPPWPNSEEATG